MTRGIANHNPMNLRDYNIPWDGRIGVDDKGFTVFKEPVYGIRAGTLDILNDFIKDKKTTTQALLSEFAPKTENPTENYVKYVAQAVGVKPDEQVNLLDKEVLCKFICAIIRFENGKNPYEIELINNAMNLALIKINHKP